MRRLGWFGISVTTTGARQQHWSTTLLAISVLGSLFATTLLIFDGWVDALAIYVVSGLILAVLLSRLAGQQAILHGHGLTDDYTRGSGGPRTDSALGQTHRVWRNRLHRTSHKDMTASPAVLRKAASTD